MSLVESFTRLEAAIDTLIERTRGTDDGFRKGLSEGLFLALLVLRSRTESTESQPAPPDSARPPRASTPKNKPKRDQDQLDLFKP